MHTMGLSISKFILTDGHGDSQQRSELALKSNVSSLVHACYFSPILLELDELDWF